MFYNKERKYKDDEVLLLIIYTNLFHLLEINIMINNIFNKMYMY